MLCKYFPHSMGCLFIVLIVSLAVQKHFSLMQFHLLILVLVACAFDVIFKTCCQDQNQEPFPMFATRFMALCLMLNYLIHYEFIFVSCVRQRSNFFACSYLVFSTALIAKPLFYHSVSQCQRKRGIFTTRLTKSLSWRIKQVVTTYYVNQKNTKKKNKCDYIQRVPWLQRFPNTFITYIREKMLTMLTQYMQVCLYLYL